MVSSGVSQDTLLALWFYWFIQNINQINLSKSIRVGAILRKDEIIIPNSETIFEENDDVVFFSETKSIKKLEELLSLK